MYDIGARIRYFRELRQLSQKEFSKRIGVSNTRVSNWEAGINRPDADIIANICRVLNISADDLLNIHLSQETPVDQEKLTVEEEQIILHYRQRPELHQAVRILLGIESHS